MMIPDPTLPKYPIITPRPFDIVIEARELKPLSGASSGAFYTIIEDEFGDKFLQGGSVNGVGVDTSDLKVFDSTPSPDGTWQGTNDQQLYLSVVGTGVVEDGVLLPGFEISSITPTIGTPPASTPPTADDPSGTCILTLGTFFNEAFYPDNIGSFTVAVCIGSFVVARI
jgi:hypothetical protein